MTKTVAVLVGREPAERYSVHRGYIDALWAVGAVALVVPAGPGADIEHTLEATQQTDGVLITGGGDVDPGVYGGPDSALLQQVDPDRDTVEAAVVAQAREAGRPVLGICRGVQLLAAALGGTLVQDLVEAGLGGHWEEERQYEPVHRVSADPSSLAALALAGATRVNSIHHQAVADPGPGLQATAWGDDGVIEAVEAELLLGVQWHPERLFASDRRHLAAFAWLVTA